MRRYEENMNEFHLYDNNFDEITGTLKELEGVDSSLLGQIYYYKTNEKEEEMEEARKITRDYKMNYLEPSRLSIRMEMRNALSKYSMK